LFQPFADFLVMRNSIDEQEGGFVTETIVLAG